MPDTVCKTPLVSEEAADMYFSHSPLYPLVWDASPSQVRQQALAWATERLSGVDQMQELVPKDTPEWEKVPRILREACCCLAYVYLVEWMRGSYETLTARITARQLAQSFPHDEPLDFSVGDVPHWDD